MPIYTFGTRSSQESGLGAMMNAKPYHVLNSCKVALDARQYNERQDGGAKSTSEHNHEKHR